MEIDKDKFDFGEVYKECIERFPKLIHQHPMENINVVMAGYNRIVNDDKLNDNERATQAVTLMNMFCVLFLCQTWYASLKQKDSNLFYEEIVDAIKQLEDSEIISEGMKFNDFDSEEEKSKKFQARAEGYQKYLNELDNLLGGSNDEDTET